MIGPVTFILPAAAEGATREEKGALCEVIIGHFHDWKRAVT